MANALADGDLPAPLANMRLLSINGLVAAREVFIALQTEFFALQGMSKLVEIVQLVRKRMNPALTITGILPCPFSRPDQSADFITLPVHKIRCRKASPLQFFQRFS